MAHQEPHPLPRVHGRCSGQGTLVSCVPAHCREPTLHEVFLGYSGLSAPWSCQDRDWQNKYQTVYFVNRVMNQHGHSPRLHGAYILEREETDVNPTASKINVKS